MVPEIIPSRRDGFLVEPCGRMALAMHQNQHKTEYLVRFSGIAVLWGVGLLRAAVPFLVPKNLIGSAPGTVRIPLRPLKQFLGTRSNPVVNYGERFVLLVGRGRSGR